VTTTGGAGGAASSASAAWSGYASTATLPISRTCFIAPVFPTSSPAARAPVRGAVTSRPCHPRHEHPRRRVGAGRALKRVGEFWRFTRHRRGRRPDDRVEQDHRHVGRLTRLTHGFRSFRTAGRTRAGVEAVAMPTKGRGRAVPGHDMPARRIFVHRIFGPAAWAKESGPALARGRPARRNPAP
jgi:hypothetical protein